MSLLLNFITNTCLVVLLISYNNIANAESTANEFGFGAELSAQPILGETWISCNDGPTHTTRHFICDELNLNPYDYGYFYGPKSPGATKFEITATWPNGKSRTKTGEYIGTQGRSKSTINLWIETITQRALLDLGENKISFKLLDKANSVITSGTFNIQIKESTAMKCPIGHVYSNFANDCLSSFVACNMYYQQNKYRCQK